MIYRPVQIPTAIMIPPEKHQPKRRYTENCDTQSQLTLVIINSPDVKLARINPIKIAKALTIVAKDFIKSVSKKYQGGITVTCHTTAQAQKLKTITQLDQWAVTTKYAKSETQSKGVVTGIPTDKQMTKYSLHVKKTGSYRCKTPNA